MTPAGLELVHKRECRTLSHRHQSNDRCQQETMMMRVVLLLPPKSRGGFSLSKPLAFGV
jgi:hypothetical protein